MNKYRFVHALGNEDDYKSIQSDVYGQQWWKRIRPSKAHDCTLCTDRIEAASECWRPDTNTKNKSHRICPECLFMMERTHMGSMWIKLRNKPKEEE